MGGWGAACHWLTRDLDFKRKDFIRHWVDAHGRTEFLQLGAEGVIRAVSSGRDRNTGPIHVGDILKKALSHEE